MGRANHLNGSVLDMTNTGKALIVGLVLIDLGFVSYLMFPKDDERSKAAPEAEVTQSTANAAIDPRFGGTHVTEGSVIHAPSPTTGTGKIANAGNTAPAPIAQAPQAPKQPQKQPAPATPSAQVRETVAAKPVPAPQSVRARGDLSPHGSNPVAAAMTQALVNESAKPDPSLPLPSQPLAPPVRSAPDHQDRHGSNPVAAAMTQQLVRESAKPDPSLPMPPPMQSAPSNQDRNGSNAVAAAMTQQLVRESAKVSPASQPVPRSGTQ